MSSSRGRGGSRGGRGGLGAARGRGRGGSRGRGKPIFDSARLAQQKEDKSEGGSESESSEAESEGQDDEDSIDDDDEDKDEELQPAVTSYTALMQSFAADVPAAKRRKLNQDEPSKAAEESEDSTTIDDKDHVEELEEGPESAVDGILDEDHGEDASDPFESHFANPDDNVLSQRLKSLKNGEWAPQIAELPNVGRALSLSPGEGGLKKVPPTVVHVPGELKLKQKLGNVVEKQVPSFDNLEKHVAPLIFNYQDLLFCERTTSNSESLRRLACLHAVNHVFK